MKIASWNVNGVRSCAEKGLAEWIKSTECDIVMLQEVRADPHQVPKSVSELPGMHKLWFPATSKKGYSGTGILSKDEAVKVWSGMERPEFDCEGRVLAAEFEKCTVVSTYFPNSQDGGKRIQYKIDFCHALQDFLAKLYKNGKPLVLAGDFNIAHQEIDLARPHDNHDSPGFLPAEREWMTQFLSMGWVDSFRHLHPDKVQYSWWSARTRARERNIGWRIDYHALPKRDAGRIKSASISDDVLGSDHCPVIVNLDLR